MHGQHLEQPAFLLDFPRSGTSQVCKGLCVHPGAAIISPSLQRYPKITALFAFDRRARLSKRAQEWASFPADDARADSRNRSSCTRIHPMPAGGEPVFTDAGIPIALVEDRPAVGLEIERSRQAFRSIRRWHGDSVTSVELDTLKADIAAMEAVQADCLVQSRHSLMTADGD